jgi:tetratricopeptide (TPR) repeat protein
VAEVTALPTDSTAFTGRKSELKQVIEKLPGTANGSAAGVHVIDGMPGVGKTAFAVHLAHRLAGRFPDKQVFLRLNGHTPGHSPVDPGDALGALLLTTGVDLEEIPAGTQARASMWRERVADKRVLLLLDDAVSTSQVRPLLPGHAGALVLITSRHRLSALSEATPIALEPMRPDEAAELFVQIAARPGVLPADAQVAELVRLCGCLPLALTLTAGQLKNHPAWTCGDQVDDLREATDRTSAIHAENITVTAAFEASYRQLAPGQKRFFRQLGLHPGTSIDAYAAAALAGTDMAAARLYLDALFSYHLIDEPARGRYRLHDLIRDYARVLATGDPQAEQGEAMDRLLGYYLRTAQAADRHLTRKTTPVAAPCVIPIPAIPGPVLGTRQEAVAWMTTEGLNLSATAEYAANNDRTGFTVAVAAAMHGFLRSRGSWEDQALSLQRTALDAARRTGDPAAEATALGDLGDIQALRGDFGAAAVSLARATDLYRGLGDQAGEADVLANLGAVQRVRGDFPAAATTFAQALQLYLGLGNQAGEAKALTGLGVTQLQAGEYGPAIASLAGALRLQRARGDRSGEAAILNRLGAAHYVSGDYPAAATQLTQALEMYRDLGERLGQAEVLNNLGVTQYLAGKFSAATVSLTGALELFQDLGYHLGEANALKDLGVLQYTKGEYPAAGISLTRALNLYMELDNRLGQANALDRIGVLERMTGNYPVASNSHEKALKLHQGLGHRTGEAETLNNMGDLSLAAGSSAEACAHYMKAHAIAVMITSALEEARALEGIGQCQIRDGRFHEGFITIRQALAIYRRLGSPNAQYSEKLLHDHAGQAEVRHEVDAESASRGAS